MHALSRRSLVPWLCLGLAACADAGSESGPRQGSEPDGSPGMIATRDALPGPEDAARVREDAAPGRAFNAACDTNQDCESGWCVETERGPVCSVTCLEDNGCPIGWGCRVVQNTPPDVVSVCLPNQPVDAALPPADAAPPPVDAAPPPVDAEPPPPPADAEPPPPPVDAAPTAPPTDPPTMPPTDPPTMPPTEPPTEPPVLKGYWEPCVLGAECESTFCVGDPIEGGGRCTQRCGAARDCPGLDICLDTDPGALFVGVCFRNETGQPCFDGGDCVEGVCLTPPDGLPWVDVQNICVSRCGADDKCPAGYTCEVVQTNTGPARVCNTNVRRLDICPDGFIDQCIGSGACAIPAGRDPFDIYRCIAVGEGVPGYCSCTCRSTADCPTGFGCYHNLALSGDPVRDGICLAMAGYRCPVGSVNPAVDQCPSLACLTPGDDPNEAYCTTECQADVDCPAEYTCDRVDRVCVLAF